VSLLTVELRSEGGEVLARMCDGGAFERIRLSLDDASSACLKFVEPYGNTIFNPLQAAALSVELAAKLNDLALRDDRDSIARLVDSPTGVQRPYTSTCGSSGTRDRSADPWARVACPT
jgi:hypothetical protein